MAIGQIGGPFTPYGTLGMTPVPLTAIATEWFINRLPLSTRLRREAIGTPSFKFANDLPRPRSNPTAASVADGTTTSVTVGDGTVFDVDDVIQIEGEYLLVSAINSTTNVLTVARGIAGTTAAAHTTVGTPVYLVSNTRTGGAVDIPARSMGLESFEQWLQTIQHAYSVGGASATNTGFVSAQGTPLDRDRFHAMTDCMFDLERALVYGRKVANTAPGSKPQMAGIAQILTTNNLVQPQNYAAYKQSDLIRDVSQRVVGTGGAPNALFVSTDMLGGLALWGNSLIQANAGENRYGTAISMITVPWLPNMAIIPAPELRAGTVIGLNTDEVVIREKRKLRDKPRGSRGDAEEGDMIMEAAIEVDNESHHVIIQGITGYAAG